MIRSPKVLKQAFLRAAWIDAPLKVSDVLAVRHFQIHTVLLTQSFPRRRLSVEQSTITLTSDEDLDTLISVVCDVGVIPVALRTSCTVCPRRFTFMWNVLVVEGIMCMMSCGMKGHITCIAREDIMR